jgi:hypothetical protein
MSPWRIVGIPARRCAVKLRRSSSHEGAPSQTGFVGDHADKLRRVAPLAHDEDERPSREDRAYGSTIFTREMVPLPRFLLPRKKRPPR